MRYKTVEWFAKKMDAQLWANRSKGGWRGDRCDLTWLLDKLKEELGEVQECFMKSCPECSSEHMSEKPDYEEYSKEQIIEECADLANFAMMIADKINKEG